MLDEWSVSGTELLLALVVSALAATLATLFAASVSPGGSSATSQTQGDRTRSRWVCLAILAVVAALHLNRPDDFVYTHYLFGYTDEFVRRGLVGQLVSLLPGTVDGHIVDGIATISLAALVWLMLRVFLPLGSQNAASPNAPACTGAGTGLTLLGMVVVLSPASLQHFIHDFGRHDVLLMLLLVAALNTVVHMAGIRRWALVSALLFIGVLVHEASVFFIGGPVYAFWLAREGRDGRWLAPLAACALTCAAVLVVVVGPGDYAWLPYEEHLAAMKATHGSRVDALATSVLHATTADSVGLVLAPGRLETFVEHHLIFGVIMGPLLTGIALLLTSLPRQLTGRFAFALLGCLAPLVLYPLGYDHFRWLSLMFTSGAIVGAMLLSESPAGRQAIDESVRRHRTLFLTVLWLGVVSGPLRVSNSFYWLSPLAEILRDALQ